MRRRTFDAEDAAKVHKLMQHMSRAEAARRLGFDPDTARRGMKRFPPSSAEKPGVSQPRAGAETWR